MNKYPAIYHVGLMKTGTTTIQEILGQDSRINLILKSGFFNTNQYFTKEYDYTKKGKINIESDETISRDQNYYGLDESLRRIHEVRKDAKIIITIREQRSLLVSAYKHHIRKTNDAYTFTEFLNSSTGYNYIKHLNYFNLFTDIKRYFEDSNIFFFPYELMNSDFKKFFKLLYENVFEISAPNNISRLHSNKGMTDQVIKIKRNLNNKRLFREGNLLGRLETKSHKALLKTYDLFNKEKDNHIFWEENELCKSLEDKFLVSNRKFNTAYSDLDLYQYGYLI